MEHTDQFVRATVCERRNEDARAYKILMNVAGDSREFAIVPREIRKVGRQLATCLATVEELDYVVGFAPGGIPSAMALALEVDLPMIVAYKCRLGLPGEIVWEEPHCVNSTFYLYGLRGGMRVVLVDDEVDSGATICNAAGLGYRSRRRRQRRGGPARGLLTRSSEIERTWADTAFGLHRRGRARSSDTSGKTLKEFQCLP
jgi:hypothetical protein